MPPIDPTQSFWPAPRLRQWREVGLYTAGLVTVALLSVWSFQSGDGIPRLSLRDQPSSRQEL